MSEDFSLRGAVMLWTSFTGSVAESSWCFFTSAGEAVQSRGAVTLSTVFGCQGSAREKCSEVFIEGFSIRECTCEHFRICLKTASNNYKALLIIKVDPS